MVGLARSYAVSLATSTDEKDYKDALPFTSVLAIDFARELKREFDSSRVHGQCDVTLLGRHPDRISVVYGMSKE